MWSSRYPEASLCPGKECGSDKRPGRSQRVGSRGHCREISMGEGLELREQEPAVPPGVEVSSGCECQVSI